MTVAEQETAPEAGAEPAAEKPAKTVTIRGISFGVTKIKSVEIKDGVLMIELSDGAKAVVPKDEVAAAVVKLKAAGIKGLPG